MKFSKSTGCFYPDEIQYALLPSDLVDVSEEDFKAAMARAPDEVFDVINGRVVVAMQPGPTVEAIKASQWERIKAVREKRKGGGIKTGDKWLHSDTESRMKHLALKDQARDLLAAGGAENDEIVILGKPLHWKTMDGSFIAVTVQLAFDAVSAAVDLDTRLFEVAESHRAALEVAPDPATYDFSGGWPEAFGDQEA